MVNKGCNVVSKRNPFWGKNKLFSWLWKKLVFISKNVTSVFHNIWSCTNILLQPLSCISSKLSTFVSTFFSNICTNLYLMIERNLVQFIWWILINPLCLPLLNEPICYNYVLFWLWLIDNNNYVPHEQEILLPQYALLCKFSQCCFFFACTIFHPTFRFLQMLCATKLFVSKYVSVVFIR